MKYKFEPDEAWIANFWSKVDKSGGPDACHPWTGLKFPGGYGSVRRPGGHPMGTHVAAFLLSGGQTNEEEPMVLHSCHNRACCNNAHLSAGDHTKNMRDMVEAGRSLLGDKNPARICPEKMARGDNNGARKYPERLTQRGEGHWARKNPEQMPRGEKHYRAKLTEDTVRAIIAAYAAGASQRHLRTIYGVSRSLIGQVVRREIWRHVS